MDKKLLQNLINSTILNTEANFYKLLVENLGEEITVSDGDGNYLFVNTASVETIAVDVIKNVGPVGNFLGQRHTLKHVRELSLHRLFDRRSRESWEKDGSTTIQQRAHIKALEHFAEHKAPELELQIVAKLEKIISDAEAELDKDI